MTLFRNACRGVLSPRLAAGLAGLALLAGAPAILAQDGSESPGNNADNQPGQPLNTPPEAMVTRKDPLEFIEKLRFHQRIKGPGEYGLD